MYVKVISDGSTAIYECSRVVFPRHDESLIIVTNGEIEELAHPGDKKSRGEVHVYVLNDAGDTIDKRVI